VTGGHSPDLNSTERLWLTMKTVWFRDIHCKDRQSLIERADKALLDMIHNLKRIAKTDASIATEF
jgi:transposase